MEISKKLYLIIFLFFLTIVFIKAVNTPVNHDLIFHYNYSTGNYVDFDGKHPVISYQNRPPMVGGVSQPTLIIGGLFSSPTVFFWLFWFALCFIFFPLVLFFFSNKNFLVFNWFWAFGFAYEYWFSGVFAQLLALFLWLGQLWLLEKKVSVTQTFLLFGILILGMLTHSAFVWLYLFTLGVKIVFLYRQKISRHAFFLSALGLIGYSVITKKILYVPTIFSTLTAPFFLFVRNTGFRFWLMILLYFLSFFWHLRISSFAMVLVFFNVIQFAKENKDVVDWRVHLLVLFLAVVQFLVTRTSI